jgi:hypothetical protein
MLKAIAIFVAVAITAVCATVLLGYSSCQQSPEQSSETAKTEKTHEKYCTSSYRMFTVGLFDVKEFIHENRDDINAVSTIFIAAFTIILGLFTISLARSTRIAANAAKEAADAVSAVERARFFIVVEEHNLSHLVRTFQNVGRLTPGENISIKFCFKNYGKTPGILKERIIGSVIADELPDSLPLLLSIKDFPETMIGSADETKSDWFSPYTIPTTPEIGAIARNSIRFWLYGRLYYDDVFGEAQVHCFYFRSKSDAAANQCVLEPVEPKDHKKST